MTSSPGSPVSTSSYCRSSPRARRCRPRPGRAPSGRGRRPGRSAWAPRRTDDAGDVERLDRLGHLVGHLPGQVDEAHVLGQVLQHRRLVEAEDRRQAPGRVLRVVDDARVGHDRRLRDRDGEVVAVAVEDRAPPARELDGLDPLFDAVGHVLGRADRLHVHQPDHGHREQGQHGGQQHERPVPHRVAPQPCEDARAAPTAVAALPAPARARALGPRRRACRGARGRGGPSRRPSVARAAIGGPGSIGGPGAVRARPRAAVVVPERAGAERPVRPGPWLVRAEREAGGTALRPDRRSACPCARARHCGLARPDRRVARSRLMGWPRGRASRERRWCRASRTSSPAAGSSGGGAGSSGVSHTTSPAGTIPRRSVASVRMRSGDSSSATSRRSSS